LDDLQQDVELKAIKEANERMRQLPNNKNKIGSIQEKIKQLKPESASTDTLNTITTALQLITGSDETLKTIVGNHETLIDKISKIKSNVLYFQRC
jgi:DNA repair ATPase RecN